MTAPERTTATPVDAQIVRLIDEEVCPWVDNHLLAETPPSLLDDLESRVLDHFWTNWSLYSGKNGQSSGSFPALPMLYLSSPPQSIFWHAVRALAFADMKDPSDGEGNFTTRALDHYGAALNNLQHLVDEGQLPFDDRILTAMLLIDVFEVSRPPYLLPQASQC